MKVPQKERSIEIRIWTLAASVKIQFLRSLFPQRSYKRPPAWSFPGALWRLLVDSNTFRGRQRHGIGFEQRATRSSVADEVFRALVRHMTVSRRTPRSWHVSQGFTLSKNNGKAGISGLRLVHTLDTAGKAYYSQLWKLVTPTSTQRASNCSTWGTRISRQHSTTSPMPLLVVLENLRLAIPRLWLTWCGGKCDSAQRTTRQDSYSTCTNQKLKFWIQWLPKGSWGLFPSPNSTERSISWRRLNTKTIVPMLTGR